MRIRLTLIAVFIGLVSTTVYGQMCFPPRPIPSGVTDRLAEIFDPAEYGRLSGSVPLQGNRAETKYAPIMFSAAGGGVGNFETTAVFNNPDPLNTLDLCVSIFGSDGTEIPLSDISIPPSGNETISLWQLQSSGYTYGMLCATVKDTSPVRSFVGATVYSANMFTNPFDSDLDLIETDDLMVSVQPMQQLQNASPNRLSLGPFPARLDSDKAVLNGNFSLINIVNPSDNVLDIVAIIESDNGPTQVISVPPVPANGGIQLFDLWLRAIQNYITLQPGENMTLTLIERNGQRFVAEALVFDLLSNEDIFNGSGGIFGDDPGTGGGGGTGGGNLAAGNSTGSTTGTAAGDPTVGTLPASDPLNGDIDPQRREYDINEVGGRARMESFMPVYGFSDELTATEVTDLSNEELGTVVLLTNVSPTPADNVVAWYYDENGSLINFDDIGTVNRLQGIDIGLGCPDTPNFPTGGMFRGWIRITQCNGKLIGHVRRFNESENSTQKMWGELLHGNGGLEHKKGWFFAGLRHIIAPVVLEVDDESTDSSFISFLNRVTSNIGNWRMEVFDETGNSSGVANFTGLQSFSTAGWYFDGAVFTFTSPQTCVISNEQGTLEGVNLIGGPLLGILRFGENPYYPGPGDTVPF